MDVQGSRFSSCSVFPSLTARLLHKFLCMPHATGRVSSSQDINTDSPFVFGVFKTRYWYLHNPVNSQDQREVMRWQSNGLQNDGDGEDSSSWHACCPYTGRGGSHSRGRKKQSRPLIQCRVGTEKQNLAAMTWKPKPTPPSLTSTRRWSTLFKDSWASSSLGSVSMDSANHGLKLGKKNCVYTE